MSPNTSMDNAASTAANVYAQSSVENAPPLKIVRLLYQGAIRFLDNAAACDLRDRGSKFNHWLGRAEDIVIELRASLNSELAPELALSLTDLYLFVEVAIHRARREQTVEPLSAARSVLVKLLEAWTAIETGKA